VVVALGGRAALPLRGKPSLQLAAACHGSPRPAASGPWLLPEQQRLLWHWEHGAKNRGASRCPDRRPCWVTGPVFHLAFLSPFSNRHKK
jgi:hypothetical protein